MAKSTITVSTIDAPATRLDADGREYVDAEVAPIMLAGDVSESHAAAWREARSAATASDSHSAKSAAYGVAAATLFARAYGTGADLPRIVDADGAEVTRGRAWAIMHARPYRDSDESAASRAIGAARVVARVPDAAEVGSIEALSQVDRATRAAVKRATADGKSPDAAKKSAETAERAAVRAAVKRGETGAAAKRTIIARIDAKRGDAAKSADAKKSARAKSARAAARGEVAAVATTVATTIDSGDGRALAVALAERVKPDTLAAWSATLATLAAERAAEADAESGD